MADIEGLIERLANLEIRRGENEIQRLQQQQRQESLADVLKRASMGILKFDKTKTTNFLNSVELHYDATAVAHRPEILKVAQQKVVGSFLVETTAYATFAAFKADIVGQFKPTKSHGQLESEMSTLALKPAETVELLAQRVVQIKVEYEIAYRAELLALGAVLDAVRLQEVERKALNAFRNALPLKILTLMGGTKTNLNEEINSAMAAAANQEQRDRNFQLSKGSFGSLIIQ